MERNAIQWLGAPCCLRGSFAFYKSFCCRREEERPAAVWKLGEFYFLRCGPQEPVCVAELALLWEDRAQRHLLASSRLYFLPEDTPKGRTGEHGEDEVLAVSKKMVIRVEDLVNWTCPEPSGWKRSGRKVKGSDGCNGTSPAATSDPGEPKAEPELEREGGVPVEQQRVRVLSYLQYCRFRSLQRRIQDPPSSPGPPGPPGPQDPHLLALGGIRTAHHNTLVLYCRDTFNHPTLDSSARVWTQLGCTSLSLKGRPRKRRGRDGKGMERPPLNQSESWIEKMKENVMGSVEVPWEGGWLPHPEEQPFLDQLFAFMEHRGSPISKVPNLGFKKIDLFLLFSVVKRLGGYERLILLACRLILAYEQHLMGGGEELSKPQLSAAANRSKELQKGKGAEVNQKEKTSSPNGPTSPAVPVRKRGRPPSRRNSKAAAKASSTEATPPQSTPATRQEGSLFQELNFSNLQNGLASAAPEDPRLAQPLAPSPPLPPQPKAEPGVKVEDVAALSPASLSALTRLHMSGPPGAFSLPKGLCPLDLFRSRLGLGGVEGPDPPTPQHPSVLLYQPKTAAPEGPRLSLFPGGRGDERGQKEAGEGRGRPPMPPLRILPLDIDCSLQVRQLMRTRLGSSQLNSFAKKLTEVLAQDLGRAPHPAPPAPANQEQALPLNLSKRCGAKRPAEDEGGAGGWQDGGSPLAAKRARAEWDGSTPPGGLLKHSACGTLLLEEQEEQEEPADLSCPRRARASLREQSARGAGSPCPSGPAGLGLQPPLANGADGGGAWDSCSDTGADCRGAE
ncbi:AT-rich interactive domain-containing protein 5B [Anguilla rostrata]|uniref:AT-rich interactive domain-containing protein 5B n=1 Tax=Anguilla rostrata TaxID=7938 RepID=UPI0030CDD690